MPDVLVFGLIFTGMGLLAILLIEGPRGWFHPIRSIADPAYFDWFRRIGTRLWLLCGLLGTGLGLMQMLLR
ncbi:MAG: hypothetical protein AB7V43_06280 [Acidimicrobiia bacterium]